MILLIFWLAGVLFLAYLRQAGAVDITWFWVFSPLIFGYSAQLLASIMMHLGMRYTENRWRENDPDGYWQYKWNEARSRIEKQKGKDHAALIMDKYKKAGGSGSCLQGVKKSPKKSTRNDLH